MPSKAPAYVLAALIATVIALGTGPATVQAQQVDVIRGRITGPDSLPVEGATVTAGTSAATATGAAATPATAAASGAAAVAVAGAAVSGGDDLAAPKARPRLRRDMPRNPIQHVHFSSFIVQ